MSSLTSSWATRPGVPDPTLPGRGKEAYLRNVQALFDLVQRDGQAVGRYRFLKRDLALGDFRGDTFLRVRNVSRPRVLSVGADAKAVLNLGDAPGLNLGRGILNIAAGFKLARSGRANLDYARIVLSGETLDTTLSAYPKGLYVNAKTTQKGTKIGWGDLSRIFADSGAPEIVKAILGQQVKALRALKLTALTLARR